MEGTTYNKRRHLCNEGKVMLDGVTVLDAVKFKVVSTPEIAESRGLGERVKSKRYKGVEHKVTLTTYKSTKAYKGAIQKYLDTGETPECGTNCENISKRKNRASRYSLCAHKERRRTHN